jgi:hypothetical protein
MDLWIRSQNKENLLKAENLGVYNEKLYVNGHEENGYCIGIYKSKERALEVLNGIENFKTAIDMIYLSDKKRNDLIVAMIKESNSFIYDMPKE